MDSSMESLLIEFIINLIFTVLMYETVPVILKFILKKSYSEKEAKKLATQNTVCAYILITIFHIFFTDNPTIANPFVATLWGTIAFNILKGKQTECNDITKNEEPSASIDVKRYCVNCGHQMEEMDKYCTNCGNAIHAIQNTTNEEDN